MSTVSWIPHMLVMRLKLYRSTTLACIILASLLSCITPLNAAETDEVPAAKNDNAGRDNVLKIGRTPSAKMLEAQPAYAFADGRGLPSGSGLPAEGAAIYNAECAACHGSNGQGGAALELVGDRALLATEYPDNGIAVYWPYAPPLFDYIQRSMPPDKPYSLTADQTYAVISHLLAISGLISNEQRVDAAFLSALELPNREGFNSLVSETP